MIFSKWSGSNENASANQAAAEAAAAAAAQHKADLARLKELEVKVAAINRSQAVIEFNLDGTVITANQNFLSVLGYTASEVVGRHHSMFVERDYAGSNEYRAFWEKLNRGEFSSEKFKRIAKGGREVWIQASYNPLLDDSGKPFKVIKFATDVTAVEEERRQSESERNAKAAEQGQVVGAVANGLRQLADGNMAFRLSDAFPREYEQLRNDFNEATTRLQTKVQDALEGINTNADAIRSGTADMSRAADELSQRTEQQAASLEETAAALGGITQTVHRTAESAKIASTTVQTARSEAEHSGEIVGKAVAAMQQIEQSSRKVSQIIGVIDEIAFQTNLLALNAGVEAARAGDAGRGFAVVASEVRALAQRAAEAAKEIKGLISASSQHVEQGSGLVGETGQALQRIVSRVNEINKLVVEIASGAQEQAVGLAQVNTAISEMDRATQQNAAMVEESTAAIHALAREADVMVTLMAKFEIGDSQGASRTSAPPASPSRPAHKASSGTRGQQSAPRQNLASASGQASALRGKLSESRSRSEPARPVRHAAAGGSHSNDGWEEF